MVVAALIIPSGYYLVPAILNYGCVWGSTAGCGRAGIELLVIPIGVIAGALLWRRLGLAIRLEASRIGPWLPTLGPGVLLGALLVLFWTWGDGYFWYDPVPLSGAAVLAAASFVVGRFHPRTSAVLAISIGVPTIPASILATCGYHSVCTEGPIEGGVLLILIWGGPLASLVALQLASALMRRWMLHGLAWVGLVALFVSYVGWGLSADS